MKAKKAQKAKKVTLRPLLTENFSIQCLDEKFVSFKDWVKEWKKVDKQYPEQVIQRFLSVNQSSFDFLGIRAERAERDGNLGVQFTTGKYVGSAPLRSPVDGRHYRDIEVKSRYGEDIAEVANLLEQTVVPEYLPHELLSTNRLKSPVYLDCINYFTVFRKAMSHAWNRFEVTHRIEQVPLSSTNWDRYVEHSYDPARTLEFENRKSVLSKNHSEWYQLTYILKYALDLFLSHDTPVSLRCKVKNITDRLSVYARTHTIKPTDQTFRVSNLDPTVIRDLKHYANILIERNRNNRLAWRIDSSILFERYVQYIFTKVASNIAARCISNAQFSISGNRPSWCLKYLEPDILLQSDDSLVVIDAKYKAHLYNTSTGSDDLKETFRHDLHQLLAYSSFDSSESKVSILVYPHGEFKKVGLSISGGLSRVSHKIYLLGISFDTKRSEDMVKEICNLIK